MSKPRKRIAPRRERFTPTSIEDVFAIYLSRELDDSERVRWYARLTQRYSLCLLLNALRQARKDAGREKVEPEEFLVAFQELLSKEDLR